MKTNRLTPYEAGWLTMLVNTGIATREEANAALHRVAQEAIDEMNRRREQKRLKRRRRRDEDATGEDATG